VRDVQVRRGEGADQRRDHHPGYRAQQLCFRTLIRNAENQNELNIPGGTIRTYILDIKTFEGAVNWNKTKSFVVHLAGGTDERSRSEFDVLKQKNLLNAATGGS
jgi:hypothetical protein